jgi:hypothetical protein
MMMKRRTEAAERFAERRRLEDAAPRLHEAVPDLTACKIDIEEWRSTATSADVSHTRRVVVDHAPALFVIPCGDSACRDGGYDVTSQLMRGLREGRREVLGDDTCHGSVGTTTCGRILKFTAHAEYKPKT